MDQTLEIIGTLVGLLYLWLEYRASIHLWVAGIVMPAIYIVVYYRAGLYADFGINVYYLLVAAYGWLMWRYGSSSNSELSITRMPLRVLPLTAVVFAVCWSAITWILVNYTTSDVPYWDSFTTALSVVGLWMLARKYVEQWVVWIVVDAASAVLYIYKGLHPTAALYALYTVIAVFGYFKWKKMMEENNESAL